MVFCREVVRESLAAGVAFVPTTGHAPSPPLSSQVGSTAPESAAIPAAIRIVISAAHDPADIDRALQVLRTAVDLVMKRFEEEPIIEEEEIKGW